MSGEPVRRRDLLTTAAFAMAGVGGLAALWPFVAALGACRRYACATRNVQHRRLGGECAGNDRRRTSSYCHLSPNGS
jgi:Ubiquitinol-cytochrome C reductase Fe-S subunit TAT signal